MKFLISGSSGLIGSALVDFLRKQGHSVTRLLRNTEKLTDDGVVWNPQSVSGDFSQMEGFDFVINLAGESISGGRWDDEKKKRIRDSRVLLTEHLCHGLSKLEHPPKMLINASAMGYYGNRGDATLTENDSSGTGFLANVCRDWELATGAAQKSGIPVARLRFGIVLSQDGGALKQMLLPFKLGLGGKIGSGTQYMSWVTLEDVLQVIHHIVNSSLSGPINVGTPNPVTNAEFTETLGKVLNRPTFLTVPEFGVRLVFGELADEGLLSSTKMVPQRLINSGYYFQHSELKDALESILK